MGALIVVTNDNHLGAVLQPLASCGQIIVDWESYCGGFFDSSLQSVEALIIDQASIGFLSAHRVARWRRDCAPNMTAIHVLSSDAVVTPELFLRENDQALLKPTRFLDLLRTLDRINFRFGFDREKEFPFVQLLPQRLSVAINEKEIALTKNEFRLFAALYTESGATVSYGSIAEQVWGMHVSRSLIASLLSDLRIKLDLPAQYLETVENIGVAFAQISAGPHI